MRPDLPGVLPLFRLVLARLKGMEPRVLAFGSVPPDDASRGAAYVILDGDPGWDERGRGDDSTSERHYRFHLRCVGSSKEQALFALDEARTQLQGWRPFTSRAASAVYETDSDPLTVDRSVPTDNRYVFGLSYQVDY